MATIPDRFTAWFRDGAAPWLPVFVYGDRAGAEDRAAALAERNGLEYVILPKGVVPDGNDPRRKRA